MKRRHFTTLGLVIALATVLVGVAPLRGQGQVECLLCLEWVTNEEDDPEKDPKWVWWHYFDLDSGKACADDPAEMCRACGGSSGCHPPGDPDQGKCHSTQCAPVALLEIGSTVTKLALRLDDRTVPVLALMVAREPRLVYDGRVSAVKLTRCDGAVVGTWHLGESARLYFST